MEDPAAALDALAVRLATPPDPARKGPSTHLSIDEAAAAAGVGRSRVFELLGDGALASVRLGRRRWVTAASVAALLATSVERAS
jgi:excisionase family DNA binding protein